MTAVHSDDLELLERLGGSGAVVHRAMVRTTGRVVVVKRAPWDRPAVAERLGREAAVLRRVQHPSLVRLLDLLEDDTGRTLVLAHAPGGSLADRVRRWGPLPPTDVADLGGRVTRALAALHGSGVIHRDVHPGNVLVDAELQPVLADLDNALDTRGTRLPGDDDVVGDPRHVDPRLFRGAPSDAASDLHALATTLWTAATGSPPPRSGRVAPVQLPEDARVPRPLREVLLACLAGSAGGAATVATHLDAAAAELLHLPGSPTAPPPAGSPHGTPRVDPAATLPTRLVAGGVGGAGDPVTRRWGPAPRPQPVAAGVPRRRGRLVVAVAVLLVPVVLLGWFGLRGDHTAAAPSPATPVAAVPPAPCPASHVPADPSPTTTASDPAPALADLDGDGCSEVVRLVDGVLHGPGGRYRVGEPGDVLLTGDWDGDGRWGVGLYRPATGALFLFDEPPGAGARSRPAQLHARHATPLVVETTSGAHRVQVTAAGRDTGP